MKSQSMLSSAVLKVWVRILVTTLPFCSAPGAFAGLVRGPYLQAATTTNVVIRWRTDNSSDSRVRFGPGSGNLSGEVTDGVLVTDHQLVLTNLTPATAYSYTVGTMSGELGNGSFVTPSSSGGSVRIWAIGDSGTSSTGSQAPARVLSAYRNYANGRRTDVWLMLGDNAYFSGTDSEYQAAVFDVYGDLLRTTALWPALGNHETYAPDSGGALSYFDIFTLPADGRAGGVPSGTERYYSFDHANIHFVCLDSETSDRSASGTMVQWLEQDLASNTKEWTIAYWHSPPYSRGSHDSDFEGNLIQMRESVVPVLESYGVDMVLCGHSHSYERSAFLNGHYGNSGSLQSSMILDGGSGQTEASGAYLKSNNEGSRGAVYVVAGSAGQTSGGLLNHPAMYVSLNRLGSVVIDVTSNRLEASFLRDTGVVEDHFTIMKGSFAPSIVAHPTGNTVFEGDSVIFSTVAHGTPPLAFQWFYEGQLVPGATNSVLQLTAISAGQAGAYSVRVANDFGDVISASASLLVRTDAPNCLHHAAGLVAWWAAEGNALDAVGPNHGALKNGAGFGPGRIGQGFAMDGINDFVLVPDSASLALTGELSLELWFKANDWGAGQGLLDKRTVGDCNYGSFMSRDHGVQLYYGDRTISGSYRFLQSGPLPSTGIFHHFVGTFRQVDGTHVEMKTFIDGVLFQSGRFDGNLTNTTNSAPIAIGSERGGVADFFNGIIDEVAIYNRALSTDEVVTAFRNASSEDCVLGVPPAIATHPSSQTVREGEDAVLTVFASGSPELRYEWRFEGVPIEGAFSSSLILTNIRSAQAGSYAVIVANDYGTTVSAAARIIVLGGSSNCLPHPSGLVSWWPAEGDARDAIGPNNGQLMNGARFGPGKVGQGFLLDGVNDFVLVPDSPSLDLTNEASVELWFNAAAWGAGQGLVDKRSFSDCNYGIFFSASFGIQQYYADRNVGYQFLQSSPLPSTNVFHHFVGTFRQADDTHVAMVSYLDGVPINSGLFFGKLAGAANDAAMAIGSERAGAADFFKGVIDEVAIYNRELQGSEVLASFQAGSSGLCDPLSPPIVVTNPVSITVTQGMVARLSVSVTGVVPIHYQWFVNQNAIPGGTNRVLELTNARLEDAGDYFVVARNAHGAATSGVARVVVVLSPSVVQVVGITAASGGMAVVPIELESRGTENALSFSLEFDPRLLRFARIELAPGIPAGTALITNINHASAGQVGLAVALEPGSSFTPGAHQLVHISFLVGLFATPQEATLTFGDQPTLRQISDSLARSTPGIYLPGLVRISAGEFEGDVAPPPEGDRLLSVIDLVEAGRIVVGFDQVTGQAFQRADCAPRQTGGNGAITVADWVQIGRYAANIDPPAAAAGPLLPEEPATGGGGPIASVSDRKLTIATVVGQPGSEVNVPIALSAQGDENAFGLSVTFDPLKLHFLAATKSLATTNGTLNVNATRADSGRIGVALAMPTGTTLRTGLLEVLSLRFQTQAGDAGTVPLTVATAPVFPEVVSSGAATLATEFVNGAITLGTPGPRLSITRSGNSLVLFWPASAQVYQLHVSEAHHGAEWTRVAPEPVEIGGQMIVPYAIGENRRFFRLVKP